MRLDRFIGHKLRIGNKAIRQLLLERRVRVGDALMENRRYEVSEFCRVSVDGEVLQDRVALYVMLNKPSGCVSVRNDPVYPSAFDWVGLPGGEELHTAGRLDLDTTGLLLLTNDGAWSRRLTDPQSKKPKTYLVETSDPIGLDCKEGFAKGIHLMPEDVVTQPAAMEILGERVARLTIYEGKYRQIKRMFWRFENKVVKLRRESMGEIVLDSSLSPGEYRELTAEEIATV